MYHTKKIALFVSHIYGDYQKNVCQGVVDSALEYGYHTEIYTTSDGEDLGDFGLGEESVLRIPNFNDLSGIIVASGTYPKTELKEQILNLIHENYHGPIIEISEVSSAFPAITLENNITTGSLTEHLITIHDDKRICFLGCKEEQFFSDQRENAYRDVMRKYSLPVAAHDTFLCSYTSESVKDALSFFTDDHLALPDAIVCYNDRLALLLTIESLKAGYHIPKDFALVGCDHTKEGQNITPPLTTVTFPVYKVGSTAVHQLIRLMREESIPARTPVFSELCIGGSCGCSCRENPDSIFFGQELLTRIHNLESSTFTSLHMSADFSHISDIDEGMDILAGYISEIEHCSEFYLCLYPDWNTPSEQILSFMDSERDSLSTEHTILLKLAVKAGKRLPECSFSKNSLLPDYIYQGSESAYIISPLFFENHAFGYVVLSYENNEINYPFQLVHWMMNISRMLQNICDASGTKFLLDRLDSIYSKDSLTGLFNRHGFHSHLPELLCHTTNPGTICACLFDMDRLKEINDHHGHTEGDFALSVIAQAIENASSEDMLCTRFGGDEFYVLSNSLTPDTAADFTAKVNRYLTNYNRLGNKPYTLSVSIGIAFAPYHGSFLDSELDALFNAADENMYSEKKKKHQSL